MKDISEKVNMKDIAKEKKKVGKTTKIKSPKAL